jgi:NAD-dependent dihydropyrimidine dehydrogenase PreA subunit
LTRGKGPTILNVAELHHPASITTDTLPLFEREWGAGQEEDIVTMTYVITQPCIGVKDASCVDVCPVDCIHPTQSEEDFDSAEMLYINPDECIDCGACEPACPVTAIFEESAVPAEWKQFIKINADFFKG